MSGTGRIVIVTGATGSGKTTTCRALLDQMDEPWLHFGVDLFLGTVISRRFVDGGARCTESFHFAPDDPDQPAGPLHLELARYGAGMLRTLHEMAAAAARSGQNLLLDHVTTVDPPILQDCVARLRGLPVLLVGLKLATDVREARIDERLEEVIRILGPEQGPITNARSKQVSKFMYDQIFSHDHFDLTVNTGTHSPAEVTAAVRRRLAQGPGEAFHALARDLDVGAPPFG